MIRAEINKIETKKWTEKKISETKLVLWKDKQNDKTLARLMPQKREKKWVRRNYTIQKNKLKMN